MDVMKERSVRNTDEMVQFAVDFVTALVPEASAATVLALSGELGAGKTTFAQAVAKKLGVEETVNSPTFVIEKIYPVKPLRDHAASSLLEKHGHGVSMFNRLVHIDAYRLKGAEELHALGWDELIADPENLIIIEWPEHVEDAIPMSAHRISIAINDGDARTITYDR